MEVGHDPLNTACSHTVNVKKTWSSSTDAVYRVQKQKHGAMCFVLRVVSLLGVQRSLRVLLVQVTRNGSQKWVEQFPTPHTAGFSL